MAKKITDADILAIDTLQKAKDYADYNGKTLDDSEKVIFDSPLLKKDDGADDLDKIRMAAWLLANLKEGKEIIKTEKMGLSANAHEVLIALIGEQKADSEVYQVVNSLGSDKPIDRVINQFEDILFSDSDPFFDKQIENKATEKAQYLKKLESLDGEIAKLESEGKYSAEIFEKQTDLRNRIVNILIPRLKGDLRTGNGRKFFDSIVDKNDISLKERYRSTVTETSDSYGSIIKTGYTAGGKSYVHPVYLITDFQGQIWTILKGIDKDKLFEYIDSSNCAWDGNKKKKFKKVFTRVANLNLSIWNPGDKSSMSGLSNKGLIQGDTETYRYMSDIFYIMHALFPKDSDYKNSPFLKKDQKSCLQFNDTEKSIDTPYKMYWRGADASIIGVNYSETSPSIMRAPFPCEEVNLTWANGQIPEFFWQVYNNDEAIDFSVYDEILDVDAVGMRKIREEEVTVYEDKIRLKNWFSFRSNGTIGELTYSYQKYVENLIKGAGVLSTDEINKLRSEWEDIAREMIDKFSGEIVSTFATKYKKVSYEEIKNKKAIFNKNMIGLIERFKGGVDKVDDDSVINKWDKWKTKADAVLEDLRGEGAKLGKKISERREIDSKMSKVDKELEAAKKSKEDAKKLRVSGLITQFRTLRDRRGMRSYRELLFMRNILGWISKWKVLKTDDTFDPDAELAKLDVAEAINKGKLAKYDNWIRHNESNSFIGRLEKWKKEDGKYFNDEAVKVHLESIKDSLESVDRGLDPVEQSELDQIIHYIQHGPVPMEKTVTPMELKAALGVKTNVFSELTRKWIAYSKYINFKTNGKEIQELVDKINKTDSKLKAPVIDYCKKTLAKKPELVDDIYELPDPKDKDQAWLDWFLTRDPEVVIHTIALHELKADNNLKAGILQKMKDYKDSKDKLILLDRTIYGDGKEFSEAGIIRFYAEQLGGQDHATKKYEKPFQDSSQGLSFWRWSNPGVYLSIFGLLVLGGGLVWAWLKRKTIAAWWNKPAEEEGLEELELDQEEEEEW